MPPISKIIRFKRAMLEQWNKDTSVNTIVRNMATLASGTGAARVIGAASIPFVTRIYLPEHMGVLAVFIALGAMLMPFGTLRYTMAIPLPQNDGLAFNLAVLCGLLLSVFSVFVFVFFWFFAPFVLALFSMEEVLPFWWLLPLAIMGTGMYELLTYWAVREKAFNPLAKTMVWQSGVGGAVKIGVGLLGFRPLGLLIGQVFTQAGGIFSLLRHFHKKFRANRSRVTRKRMTFLFMRYADFPKYRLPSQFLLVFATKAPLFFFAWHFGAETTGQLGLAIMILALPVNLFGQSTGKAYFAEIAKIGRKNPETIYAITKNITQKLFLAGIAPFLILLFGGPWLFQLVFGDAWREAGVFASILALYLLAQFVSSPLVNAMTVFERHGMFLAINLVRAAGLIMVFGFSYGLFLTPESTIFVYSIALSFHYAFTAYLVFKIIRYDSAK